MILKVIINILIGLIHSSFYNKEKDEDKELQEVITRKILMYSNYYCFK